MSLKPYRRKAYYYETDRMDIVHHSNYIRWLEETRIYMLEQVGLPFHEIEARGLMVPVLSAECSYKYPVKFGDEFEVRIKLKDFNGCVFWVEYEVYNVTQDKLSAVASSSHCFTDDSLKPVRLKKNYPDIYSAFMNEVEK